MGERETTNDQILEAITDLAEATSKGFERVEKKLDLLGDRVAVLEAQHKEVITRIEQVPDTIEETYGKMLNDIEDRVRALEAV